MSKNIAHTKKNLHGSKTSKKNIPKKKILLNALDSDDEIMEQKIKITKNKKPKNPKEDNEQDFENKIEKIREALKENYIQQKKLMADVKELMALHKKEIKLTVKSGNRSNSGKHTGFNKPEPIPLPLKKLLKIEQEKMPRSQITKLMYQYFTDNKMYNHKTKKEIIPNEKIKQIFGMNEKDVINFYNLQTWLKKVYKENSINDEKNVLKIED
jgi:hypothetical protein